ncbi:hypothetical protein F4780DRAFT_727222 [Xylariomycetidae sp. FL0641]|nr:hypothetical protein F4780DRAFT_727222 [Xylariomycetidae sp. FL0641]
MTASSRSNDTGIPRHGLKSPGMMLISWLVVVGFCATELILLAQVAIFFARLSILLLYIRISFPMGSPRSTPWWLIQAAQLLNLLFLVSIGFAAALPCDPALVPWGSSCVHQWMLSKVASVVNTISDTSVLILPAADVWRMRTTPRRKAVLWALLALGALAPLASIAVLIYQIPVAAGNATAGVHPTFIMLAAAEQAVAMIVGSLPPISAAFTLLVWPGSPGPSQKALTSPCLWMSRDAGSCPVRDSIQIRDTFPGPGGSTRNLFSRGSALHDDREPADRWEMTNEVPFISWNRGRRRDIAFFMIPCRGLPDGFVSADTRGLSLVQSNAHKLSDRRNDIL